MAAARSPSYRFALFLIIGALGLIAFFMATSQATLPSATRTPSTLNRAQANLQLHQPGRAIAAKLGNETIKAELGRASWKLFHTMMAQFPEAPTTEEQAALKSYIHLFQRLYPCGECAEHFGRILEEFPPQVSSRNIAAGWACHVHNQVNESLDKEIFDCTKIGDFYDCGCSGDDETGHSKKVDSLEGRSMEGSTDNTVVDKRTAGVMPGPLLLDDGA
nr:fad-linked sulfhydryl oxidase erv2 [Quercus suber]